MQRKFVFRLEDKATSSANDRDNGNTRFKCGNQLSRKPVEWSLSCVLGNKTPLGKDGSKVKKKEQPLVESGNEKARMKRNHPLLSFLSKKKLMWGKLRSKAEFGSDVVSRLGEVRRKTNLWHMVRVPSKILVSDLKLKMRRSVNRKKFEEGNEETELCKKRILMGLRCRPLSSPGDALFLPRDTSFTREPRHP